MLAGHPLRFSCDAKPVWFGYALILTCMNHQLRCFNTNDMMKCVTHFVPILGQFSVIAIACYSCLVGAMSRMPLQATARNAGSTQPIAWSGRAKGPNFEALWGQTNVWTDKLFAPMAVHFFHINGSFSQVTLIELKKQLAEESHEKESLNGALAEAGHSRWFALVILVVSPLLSIFRPLRLCFRSSAQIQLYS